MKNWEPADEASPCTSDREFEDASHVCRHLDIDLHRVDFVKEYWNGVFELELFVLVWCCVTPVSYLILYSLFLQ